MTAWWHQSGALDRFLANLLSAEARQLRPGGPCPADELYMPAARLGDDGLGFDSLERLGLAAAVSEALFLQDGGIDDTLVVDVRLGAWSAAAAAALDVSAERVCFRSSGSSGQPRRHVHEHVTLAIETAFLAELFAGRRRIVAAVPCHHIYGFLFTLMLPAKLGVPVVDLRAKHPTAAIACLRPGDLVVGHPGFWAAACRAVPDGWPADCVGVSSGAPCPDETAQAAIRAGLVRLMQVYGASETGGIGWRDRHDGPYRLMPFWRAASGGQVLLRGDGTPVVVPDVLDWEGADRFVPQGRRDAAVQVGGHNVYPGRVGAVLRLHPAVAEAVVRPMARHEGDRLKAYVVPRDLTMPHDLLRERLAQHANTMLSIAERPRAFSFGPALPVTEAGKPRDWSLG